MVLMSVQVLFLCMSKTKPQNKQSTNKELNRQNGTPQDRITKHK